MRKKINITSRYFKVNVELSITKEAYDELAKFTDEGELRNEFFDGYNTTAVYKYTKYISYYQYRKTLRCLPEGDYYYDVKL